MSLFSWLSRPAWQSKDANRRAEAAASSRDPALVALLPQLLRSDPEAKVRRAVLERVDDLTLIADRMSNDADAQIKERARQRFADLLVGQAPVAERARALKLVEDSGLLEQVAKRAPEVELRRAALERCKRPGFIAERCLEDADAGLRLELLARVEQTATLERLAEQARTRDKRLYKAIRERLDREREVAGTGTALVDKAEALCVSIEAQLRSPTPAAADLLARAELAWAELRPRIDDRYDRRWQGAIDTLRSALDAIARIGQTPAPVAAEAASEPVAVEASPVVAPAAPVERNVADPALLELQARAQALAEDATSVEIEALAKRFQQLLGTAERPAVDQPVIAALAERIAELRGHAHARALAQEVARTEIGAQIEALEQALEANQLSAARGARARIRQSLEALPEELARSFGRRLGALDQRVEKLVQWQRWSDNKVRVRLCEEVEALIGSGMHPDALANRITELKAQWKRIDDSEQEPGAPVVESGLGKRFRFLCHKALEPARGYFEKRKEVRGRRSEALGAFVERAQGVLAASETSHADLITLKREAADQLRRVDEIDPRQRGDLGKQLRSLIEQISTAIDARFAAIAEEKQKLIAQLRRQLTHAELDAALDLAKSAQKRWQGLGKGSHKSDQALWEEFRALIDPLFARRNDELKALDASREAERTAAQSLVEEMAGLGAREELDAPHLEAEIARLEDGWRSAERPRELEREYERALAEAQRAVAGRRRREGEARWARVTELAARLDAIEATQAAGSDVGADLDAAEAALTGLDAAVVFALRARLQRLRGAQTAEMLADQQAKGERLLLEYEYLAGVESPASAQAARMNLQVEKLAARMSSGRSVPADEERASLDLRWWGLGPLPVAARSELSARRQKALAAA
ncbi:MAG: DUF349 domain-containing protein [Lysobacterales bacterium]